MLTIRLGDVCGSGPLTDCERASKGGCGSVSVDFCTSCTRVGIMRLGSPHWTVGTASTFSSASSLVVAAPSRKRRHWLRVRQEAVTVARG